MENLYISQSITKTNSFNILNKKSINSIVKKYLEYVLTYKSYDTCKCYEGHLSIIINYLIYSYNINYDLDIKEDMLFDFIRFQRNNNVSEATINKRINVFKRAFKYNCSSLNLDYLKSLKEKYVTFNFLNDDEINELINYVNDSNMSLRNKLIIFLMLESGIRRKELFKIEIKNIDLKNEIIFLNYTKTNEPRFICYDRLTKKYLNHYLKSLDINEKYLFNISRNAFDSIFKRIKNVLNFRNFSAYVLRHTYATVIVNNDGNMEMLRSTMGHVKLTTTQRYIHHNKKLISTSYKKSFKL